MWVSFLFSVTKLHITNIRLPPGGFEHTQLFQSKYFLPLQFPPQAKQPGDDAARHAISLRSTGVSGDDKSRDISREISIFNVFQPPKCIRFAGCCFCHILTSNALDFSGTERLDAAK